MIRGTAKFAVEAASALMIAACMALAVLAWRLAHGPIVIDSLTPALENALTGAGLSVEIGDTALSWGGGAQAFDLRARQVHLFDAAGKPVAFVPELALAFDVPRLLRGELAPTRFDLIEPDLRAIRRPDGSLSIDLTDPAVESGGGSADFAEALLDALRRPPGGGPGPFAELRSVGVRHARLVLEDRARGQTWVVPRADVELRRDGDGIAGAAGLDLLVGGDVTRVSAMLRYRVADDTTTVDAQVEGLRPAALAQRVPELRRLEAVQAILGGTVRARLDPGFALAALAVDLTGNDGMLRLPELYPEPLPIPYVVLRARLDAIERHAVIDEFYANLGGPTVALSASAVERDGRLQVIADAELGAVPVEDLDRLWPATLAPNARGWVVENLSKGRVETAWARAALTVPLEDPAPVALRAIDGRIHFRGVDVRYFGELPTVTGVDGMARFDAARFDLDLDGGKLRDLKVGRSRIAITGLDADEPAIDIAVPIAGPLRTVLDVLDHPPLGYPAKLGLEPAKVAGHVDGTATFAFPLIHALSVEDVVFGAKAKLKDVAAEGIIADLPVSRGALSLSLDPETLRIEGTAEVQGIPAEVAWQENFSEKAEFSSRIQARATLGDGDRLRLGYDLAPWVHGPVLADLVYLVPKPGEGRLTAELDLIGATLAVEPLGWRKPAGQAGRGRFDLLFDGDRPTRVPAFDIDAPGLNARGQLDLDPAGDVAGAVVDALRIGATALRAEARRRPEGGWQVDLTGPSLDLAPLLEGEGADGTDTARSQGPEGPDFPLDLSMRLERVLLGEGKTLEAVGGTLGHDGFQWTRARIDALVDQTAPLSLRYWPEAGQYRLRVEMLDAGAALRSLRIIETMRGGRLVLDATAPLDDPQAPLSGTIELTEFTLREAPVLARLLNAISPSGFAELVGGKGIGFERLSGEWRWHADRISLANMRTAGAALGLTAQGVIDLGGDRLDLEGTIVPVYGINRIIGAIPLLGQILTGGEGQGVFAFTYKAKGPMDDPAVSVNPLSVLTPGFLRTIFFLGAAPGEEPPPDGPAPMPGQ